MCLVIEEHQWMIINGLDNQNNSSKTQSLEESGMDGRIVDSYMIDTEKVLRSATGQCS